MSRQRALVLAVLAVGAVVLVVRRGVLTSEDLLLLVVLVPSVILHEVSHGAMALHFGDDTARDAGRLTLNPVRHVDPFGTVLLPVMLALAGAPPFGYAKPVPVNPRKLRNPRDHGLVVSLVGPGMNIVIAVGAALAFRSLGGAAGSAGGFDDLSVPRQLLYVLGFVNVLLATFNLIPIPPLDGSAVIERVLPTRWWPGYLRMRQYSMLVLLLVVLLLPGVLNRVFDPALDLWSRLLS